MSMFPIKVLLAVDGSEEAERAARLGVMLSDKTDSELHIVYAAPTTSLYALPESQIYAPQTHDTLVDIAKKSGREVLDDQLNKLKEMGGEVAGTHLGLGRPDSEIVRISEDIGAGIVIVGSRGLGALRRALMGSVSESVVRHAHCPVLVVRSHETESNLIGGRLLVATDGSEEAASAVEAAIELAEATGAELHLVYVLQVDPPTPYPHAFAAERWESSLQKAKEDARIYIEKQAEHLKTERGIEAGAHLKFGQAAHEIVELGEELGVGLLVVGSRGLGGIRRSLMGSVSDAVVRHAHSPVLVVRD